MIDYKKVLRGAAVAISGFNATLTIVPFLTIFSFLILGISARTELHRWPVTYHDTFKGGFIGLMDAISFILMLAFLIALPGWLLSAPIVFITEKRKVLVKRALWFFLGVLVLFTAFWFDPTGFFDWFLD